MIFCVNLRINTTIIFYCLNLIYKYINLTKMSVILNFNMLRYNPTGEQKIKFKKIIFL